MNFSSWMDAYRNPKPIQDQTKKEFSNHPVAKNTKVPFRFVFNGQNAFCIHVESCPERWQRMQQRLQKIDLQVTQFRATTPSDMQRIEQYEKQRFYKKTTTLQRCCAYSHVRLWRLIVQRNLPYALVLEDDAQFDKEWRVKLDLLSSEPDFDPTTFETVMLNASNPATKNKWSKASQQFLTGGYIISLAGAQRLLQMFPDGWNTSDYMVSRLHSAGKSWVYFPWLIIQEGKESTIGSNVEFDHRVYMRMLERIGYDWRNNYT